ncbi:MFS transporter [Yinghuangia seranimata]|uniref:MFS transporter n=1 Tax=Yinghuangia seranimata TaxID=408067 RepID=UPI00248B832E|nr:MFS transporter [Yinghuangia seranimata]MDI2130754.1 MFS transporter [Yinghuangia seranimata]
MREGLRGHPAGTLVLASLGSFLTALDTVVVATAVPVLQEHLGASLADLAWVVNAYTLVFACLFLTGSALGDRYGRRRVFLAGVAVFTVGSVGAALSSSVGPLIAARVVQGVGGALVMPLSMTLIIDVYPREKLGGALGLWSGITGIGVAAGPVVGGAVAQGLSWQAIFWLNVPVGILLLAVSPAVLRESRGPRPQVDVPGMLLAAFGSFALTWAPVRAPDAGWGSTEVVGALVVGVVTIGAFLAWQRRAAFPMVPLGYFGKPGFTAGNGVIFVQYFSLLGSLFVIAQLMQRGFGHDALGAGLRMLPWTCTPVVVSPLAGAVVGRVGTRVLLVTGLLLQAIGLGWLAAAVHTGVGYGALVAPLVVSGVGISMGFPAVGAAVAGAVPPQDAGVASGISRALGQLGGAFGVAVLTAVFAANGGYGSPGAFIDGAKPALWVAAVAPLVGLAAAAVAPGRTTGSTRVNQTGRHLPAAPSKAAPR